MARVVFGLQPAREAIRAHGAKSERLFVEHRGGPKIEALARFAADQGVPVETLSRAELDRRAAGVRHQGVLLLAPELRLVSLDALLDRKPSIVIALDGVMDPQNFGAVIRSAVALGADAVLWPEHSSAPLSPATFRASAGAIEHATLCRVRSLKDALVRLADAGMSTVALDAQGEVTVGEIDLTGPVALVIGAEDKGIQRSVRRICAHVARLPMTGAVASLNASVAGAVALYEVIRQRGAASSAAS